MQPRQELVDIWRSVVKTSWSSSERTWVRSGAYEPNSISDAEQLLCLLMPAVQVPAFGLDQPDKTGNQALSALEPFGGASEIPRRLISILLDYFERYTVDGKPMFAGGSYFAGGEVDEGPSEDQRTLDIVDSYAMSITLSLATLGFVRVYRRFTSHPEVQQRAASLEKMASTRLSAAMVGLLRSFSVNVFTPSQPLGRNLVRTVNQANLPTRQVVTQLQRELRQTAATFREVLIGSGQTTADLDSADNLFECGWSWGIIKDAPEIETPEPIGDQRVGVAVDEPYLYFTVIAMDAIEDLFSERTRILGLLNDEQQRLSRALQLRSDLTRAYWATVATFRTGSRWPLEDIPWRTTDGEESEYFTLQVTSLAVKGLAQQRGSDADLMRICDVLNELASRVRITRRPVDNDAVMAMHSKGVQLTLSGSETVGKAALSWNVLEFAPLLLQRLVGIAGMLSDARQRGSVLDQADRVWEHLVSRRLRAGAGEGLWDRPQGAFPTLGEPATSALSWYYTERVVQALVVTANTIDREPLRSDAMVALASEMLSEADQIFDNELMRGTAEGGPVLEGQIKEIRVTLRRARELLTERPATSASLCSRALAQLDDLAAGRQKASEVS